MLLDYVSGIYIGCYKDGKPRDLKSAFFYNDNYMTPRKCIDFCQSNGYIYAGVQYS